MPRPSEPKKADIKNPENPPKQPKKESSGLVGSHFGKRRKCFSILFCCCYDYENGCCSKYWSRGEI
eukprot:01304.XXX_2518_2774_1 [CDS] Oithona nana genome sequencing.